MVVLILFCLWLYVILQPETDMKKEEIYQQLVTEVQAIIEGETDKKYLEEICSLIPTLA